MNRFLKTAWRRSHLPQSRGWLLLLACLAFGWPAHAADAFLDARDAFRFTAQHGAAGKLALHWEIAPGYYLYRDRITVTAGSAPAPLALDLPPGIAKDDRSFGRVQVYHDVLDVQMDAGAASAVEVAWQGCAEGGVCYPPSKQVIALRDVSQPAAAAQPASPPAPARLDRSIALGPFALSSSLLLLFATIVAGWLVGARVATRRRVGFDLPAWIVLGSALVVARLVFVLRYRDAYLQSPLAILNLRDGGWNALAAVAAAGLAAVVLSSWRTRYALPLAAALAAAGVTWLAGTAGFALLPPPASTLPPLALTDLAGRPVSIAQLAGKPVVVNLWATWCPPCRREMPVLQQGQKDRPDVTFVFVNQGESAAKVDAFLGAQGLALRNVLLDPTGSASAQLGQRALPTTLFLDRQGRVVASHVGELSYPTLLDRLDSVAPSAERKR